MQETARGARSTVPRMLSMHRAVAGLCTLMVLTGCREGDGPADLSVTDARFYLTSSPNGAEISVDNRSTGQVTPDTVGLRRGDRTVALRLDSDGFIYDYDISLEVGRTDSVVEMELPVGLQCFTPGGTCFQGARRHRLGGGLRFATSAVGSLFHWGDSGSGILWPAQAQNSYASGGMPVFAAIVNGDPVALGMNDQTMLVGRPAPRMTRADGEFRLVQHAWVLPPPSPLVRPATVRGILIDQDVVGHDDVDGVVVVRLTFRNVSDDPLVHRFAPHIPGAPVTYTDAWIGIALDPDIGSANDDWLSYDPDMDMVFAYDADFLTSFTGPAAAEPGLVGLRVMEAPTGTVILLNAWNTGGDWSAGRPGEAAGYGMLSGTAVYTPEHAHPRIGHLPPAPANLRMSVTAGPLTLAPGDEARIVVSVAVAAPTGGTFTSGTIIEPGDPLDTTRSIHAVAANLRSVMRAAEGLSW
jgi:hypothetical protein